jgi:uncharacterized protein
MNNLGVMYAKGEGGARDVVEARRLYAKSAELGNPVAMFNLGWFYANGTGGPRDRSEARRWFAKAAEAGYDKAKEALRHFGN